MEKLFFINFGTNDLQTILWYDNYYHAKEHFNTINLKDLDHVILCDKDGLTLIEWHKNLTQEA